MRIDLDFPEVYFVGNNGQGKTNILESIYYLCYGSSFRTKNDNVILNHDEDQMAAAAKFIKDGQLNKIAIQFVNNQKKIIFNDNVISDRRDIMRNIPCIVFCHGDLEFVTGSPDKKRLFFDQTLSLIDFHYVEVLRNYKNVLKSRNKLLKTNSDKDLIKIYTQKLIEFGSIIQSKRKEIIEDFNKIVSEMFNNISDVDGKLSIEYISSWKSSDKDEVLNYINGKIDYELKMKTSCYGPHRDNFKFMFDEMDFNNFASTGQLRLVSLIIRSIQGLFYLKRNGRRPILLLDDVLLELDNEKRDKFIKNLPEYEQAFYTFLPDSSVLQNSNVKIFNVKEGQIE